MKRVDKKVIEILLVFNKFPAEEEKLSQHNFKQT